jgi:hypothetical protein
MLEGGLTGGCDGVHWVGYGVGVRAWRSEALPLAIAIIVVDSRLLVFG